jgi:nucleoside-diphosphate-sugar epimerase
MQVLITGGTGFLGLSLAERLAQTGVRTVLFGVSPPPPGAIARLTTNPGPVVALPGDIRDEARFGTVLRDYGISHIVHLAAISAGPDRERHDAREILDVAVLGALSVLTAAQRHLVRRVVLVSSAAVCGPPSPVAPCAKTGPFAPTPSPPSVRPRRKRCWTGWRGFRGSIPS